MSRQKKTGRFLQVSWQQANNEGGGRFACAISLLLETAACPFACLLASATERVEGGFLLSAVGWVGRGSVTMYYHREARHTDAHYHASYLMSSPLFVALATLLYYVVG